MRPFAIGEVRPDGDLRARGPLTPEKSVGTGPDLTGCGRARRPLVVPSRARSLGHERLVPDGPAMRVMIVEDSPVSG